jgi:hypothetical protein
LQKIVFLNNIYMIKIPVSIGEAVDKITILKIKKQKIPNAVTKINEEIILIAQIIKDYNVEEKYFLDLQDVNEKLWNIEDDIRIKEKKHEFDDEFIQLARNVYKNNDARFKIKSEINNKYNSNILEFKHFT